MISIIIPTLNEAAHITETLANVRANAATHEVIVVDGGSLDGTPNIARELGVTLLSVPVPGRSTQMNAGAAAANGAVFLFLHADTRLRSDSLDQIETALKDGSVVGGGFARQFDSPSPFLRLTCWLAKWRCRRFGWFLGDQAVFVRRSVFEQLGGFKPMRAFEDLDFSRRLARCGRVVTLSPGVVSSARRFVRRGAMVTTFHDLWLTLLYLGGSKRWDEPAAAPHKADRCTAQENKLIIFARAPRLGEVKSRLARSLGESAALDIHQLLLQQLCLNLESLPRVELRFCPDDAAAEMEQWRRSDWCLCPQGPGDLGARLQRAFAESFLAGCRAAVVIGSDCPAVTGSDIEAAWAALDRHDLVLGPARDGGYWLIGLRALQPALFQDIAWGTASVFESTLGRARSLGLSVHCLRALSDVDTEADWLEFQNSTAIKHRDS